MSPAVREALRQQLGLDDAVRWLARQSPPGRVCGVVVHDELTHDCVTEVPGAGCFLVFETT